MKRLLPAIVAAGVVALGFVIIGDGDRAAFAIGVATMGLAILLFDLLTVEVES